MCGAYAHQIPIDPARRDPRTVGDISREDAIVTGFIAPLVARGLGDAGGM